VLKVKDIKGEVDTQKDSFAACAWLKLNWALEADYSAGINCRS
jgi:hypothetical protein